MKIIDIVFNAGFEDFKNKAEKIYTEKEFRKFIESIKKTEYEEYQLGILPGIGVTGATVYKYWAKNAEKYMYLTVISETNYIDDYGYISFVTDESPAIENIRNAIESITNLEKDFEI